MIRGNIHNGSNNQSVQKKYNICRAIYLQKYYNNPSEHEVKSIVGEAKFHAIPKQVVQNTDSQTAIVTTFFLKFLILF
jgi:hypothetical protein